MKPLATVTELTEPLEDFWVPVPGWKNYEINQAGTVRNASTKRVRRTFSDAEGYVKVTLCNGRPCKPPVRVHRLVALAFLGDPPTGMNEVNHIDGNKANNAAWNLEWVSNTHNINHSMYALGRARKIAERRRANGQFGKPNE